VIVCVGAEEKPAGLEARQAGAQQAAPLPWLALGVNPVGEKGSG